MKKPVLLSLALLFVGIVSRAQGDASSPDFNRNAGIWPAVQDMAIRDSLALWEEKVYLHTDRDLADAGEAIFFKAYVFNGPTGRRFSPSGVLRLELRDSENALVSTQYHPVAGGAAAGTINLPKKLKEGSYQVLAYTRWMQNYGEGQFFRKTIHIGAPGDAVNPEGVPGAAIAPEFFPEGGRLLAGIPNRLVLASPSPGDHPGEVGGSIVDGAGNTVAEVQSYTSGFGMAIFRPEAGKAYRYLPQAGEARNLPEIQNEGYALRVNTLSPEKIRVEVQATPSMEGNPVVLEGRKEGKSCFVHVLEFEEGTAALEISKASLPRGLMTFYLTGMDQVAWAERPVWIDARESLHIEARPLSARGRKAEQEGFRIRVTDLEGNPVRTDLSVSVTRGETPAESGIDQYLGPGGMDVGIPDARRMRFVEDLRAQSLAAGDGNVAVPGEIRYPVERSLELHGTAYDLENKLLPNTEVQMMAASDTDLVIRELKTDASGILHVRDLDVVGQTQFIFRTKGEEQARRLVKVVPITGLPEAKATGRAEKEEEVAESRMYRRTRRKNPVVAATPPVPFDTVGLIKLKEVSVEDRRRIEHELVPSLYGVQPNPFDIVYQDLEKPLPMDLLIRKIPGVQAIPTVEGVPQVYHTRRGGGGVVWIVDGQILRTGDDPYLSPLTFLTPLDILRIEFVIDAGQTAVFGVQANTAVMIVYTRSGNVLDYLNRKEGGLVFKGYEPAPDFETYRAERQKDRKLRKTPLPTLYWSPSLETDKNGEAIVRFETPGEAEPFRLTVETLTPDGRVGVLEQSFQQ